MMINKRLIGICEDSKKYIALTVLSSWISIICNILIILLIGQFVNKIYTGRDILYNSDISFFKVLPQFKLTDSITLLTGIAIIAVLLAIRYFSNVLYAKFSYLASANARVTLRKLIYKKLLKLGAGYNNIYSTSTIVQIAVEGIEALEVYFGK